MASLHNVNISSFRSGLTRYHPSGNTGIQVSEIGFGAWWELQDDANSRLILHKALDMGCNFGKEIK